MTATNSIYQSILHRLSEIPVDYLPQIDNYLQKLTIEDKRNNQLKIMQLAGCWNDMSETEFQEYLTEAKNTNVFDRENWSI